MKRDLELMQEIMIQIENSDTELKSTDITVPEYTEKEIAEHVSLLIEAGYIANAIDVTTMSTDYQVFVVKGLTLSGHDYLDSLRTGKTWPWIKSKLSDAISVSSILKVIRALFRID